MTTSSNSQKIVFGYEPEIDDAGNMRADMYGNEILPPESMLVKTFPHASGREGLALTVSDANETAYFFLTPSEASLLRLWLNARNL